MNNAASLSARIEFRVGAQVPSLNERRLFRMEVQPCERFGVVKKLAEPTRGRRIVGGDLCMGIGRGRRIRIPSDTHDLAQLPRRNLGTW